MLSQREFRETINPSWPAGSGTTVPDDSGVHCPISAKAVAALGNVAARRLSHHRLLPPIAPSKRGPALGLVALSVAAHLLFFGIYYYQPEIPVQERQASARTMEISIMSAPLPPAAVAPELPTPTPATKASTDKDEPQKDLPPARREAVDPEGRRVRPAKHLNENNTEKPVKAVETPAPKSLKPADSPERLKAKAAAPATPPPSQSAQVQKAAAAPVHNSENSGANSDQQNWQSQVLAQLEAHKRYPAAAINRGQEDVIYVRITLDRSGEVIDSQIVRSNGIALLDKAVRDMIRRASPLPGLPDSINQVPYSITVPINFFLSRR